MRVFVTGATGFIGSAVVRELLDAGHQVLGLARSDASAEALTRAGAEVQRGELADTEGLAAAAKACDGVIHLAFIHDFSAFEAATLTDQQAVKAMTTALEGSGKPFVGTSGTMTLPAGRIGNETDEPAVNGNLRGVTENITLAAAAHGVRASVVRLSPSVHGAGDHGFVPMLIGLARSTGVAAYIGDGSNRWPAVHRLDAARLFRLALEKAAPGTRLHGVAEEGIPMREIAAAIGEGVGVPVRGLGAEEAALHFGWMAMFAGVDNPASSAVTRETMGWRPKGPGLLADMRENGYF